MDEWFISMSWRDEISKVCHDIRWIPEFGLQRELDWLKNMGDWMISKKRFWGLALPIWVDEVTGDFEVIGSREELRARAVEGFEALEGRSPHKPWIDKVKIRNPKTGNLMSRIPDVGNPWLDAGIVPFSTMGYRTNREEWAKWYPADLITECFPGQFRNWFYSLLAMSSMLEGKAPFRALLGHALVRDQTGDEMHKSKGNSIPFEGAADNGYEIKGKDGKLEKHPPMGADLVRWMFCRQNPSQNINFGPVPAEEIRARFLLKLWNTYAFLCNYARLDGFDPDAPAIPLGRRTDLDRWILSDLQKLLTSAREGLENFDISSFCLEVERFVDDKLSNWYVRRNRRRFWKGEAGEDKTAAYQTLHECVLTLTRVLAPFIPFITEHMYGNLVGTRREASVHHTPWPQARPELVDDALSAEMEALLRLVSLGLAARNTAKIKVRQPLAVLRIRAGTDAERRAVERFADQMRDELNVKRVELVPEAEGAILRTEVKLNLKAAGGKLGARLKEAQAALVAADAAKVAAAASTPDGFRLELTDGPETLTSTDILVSHAGPDGWSGVADRETQVALDARVTPELARDGMARDIVRQVQDLRKRAGLEMEDRIALHLESPHAELSKAIDEHRATIAGETLVIRWTDGGQHAAEVKIDAAPLTIRLEKATA